METEVLTTTAVYGVMAEFARPEELLNAAWRARSEGYQRIDAYTPMPIEGLSEAIGFRDRSVARLVFAGGLAGAVGGYALCWWMSGVAYAHNVGGRPLNSWPAYVPITFESMVLAACITAVAGMLALNGLPQPYHPVFNVPDFERASTDRFFLCIEASDPKFDFDSTRAFLRSLHPVEVADVPA